MLKIKDNVKLDDLMEEYNLDTETIDADYENSRPGDIELSNNDGVFISARTRQVYGIDLSSLDLLYDLIKADLVEKERNNMTVKELIEELKNYDQNLELEILVKKYNSNSEVVDETIENIKRIIYNHELTGEERDSLRLEIVMYEE